MKKIALGTLFLFFPVWVFAAASSSAFSFAPPPSDLSVNFLSNIFGIVDGVLHGTGSQIMGAMFGVFNSFVLAIGGSVIMYTLVVSTMNTAQEGQMLGQKWSSIWVPLRSTLGLALLIPKASGYCLMQIFVMWVIVQGIGAADKVWAAALSYLNRGGVLVQPQMGSQTSLTSDNSTIASGASVILQGQVCMLGVQKVLENQLKSLLAAKQKPSGPTGDCVGTLTPAMKDFCAVGQIPDFLSTVNVVAEQNAKAKTTGNLTVKMPNFEGTSIFAALNGICGKIVWNPYSSGDLDMMQQRITEITSSELETAKMSRAIAIQQMYIDLTSIARVMVNNNPTLNPPSGNEGSAKRAKYSIAAMQQFGVPFLDSGSPCKDINRQCVTWGPDPSSSSVPLFNGTEFQGAIMDYNGIMLPTLNLIQQSKSRSDAINQRLFIQKANSQGWLLAGSYFFDLAKLNASAIKNSDLTDSNTGLEGSQFDPGEILSSFSNKNCAGTYKNLCLWLGADTTQIEQVVNLNNGNKMLSAPLPPPSVLPTGHQAIAGIGSSTVNGFINNSVMVNLPGQPGMVPPQFPMKINIEVNFSQYKLEYQEFPCGEFGIWPLKFCLGSLLGNIFYNYLLRYIFNLYLSILTPFVGVVIQTLLIGPLVAISQIFQQNVAIIQQSNANPVVALANMGVNYINFANELWITIIGIAVSPMLWMLMPLIALIMPLLTAWLGAMVAIGFITAYYLPLLPYMIFTFASIAWFIAVIEAMVAAPLVALGVTHPEGHDAFGKGENAIMILMNVFLRPTLMIIGYIAAIGLTYVSVWVINAGFANAMSFVQGTSTGTSLDYSWKNSWDKTAAEKAAEAADSFESMKKGYTGWAGIYGYFFSLLIYTTMYVAVVQKSFMLIWYLPDKVLRWVGGQPEGLGEQSAQWAEGDIKRGVEGAGDKTSKASAQRDKQLSGYASKLAGKGKEATKPKESDVDAE